MTNFLLLLFVVNTLPFQTARVEFSCYTKNGIDYFYRAKREISIDAVRLKDLILNLGVSEENILTEGYHPFQVKHTLDYIFRMDFTHYSIGLVYTHICNHSVDREEGNEMQWNVFGLKLMNDAFSISSGKVMGPMWASSTHQCEYAWVNEVSLRKHIFQQSSITPFIFCRIYNPIDTRAKFNFTVELGSVVHLKWIDLTLFSEWMQLYDVEEANGERTVLSSVGLRIEDAKEDRSSGTLELEASYGAYLKNRNFDWDSDISLNLNLAEVGNLQFFLNTNTSTVSPKGRQIPRYIYYSIEPGVRYRMRNWFIEFSMAKNSRHDGDLYDGYTEYALLPMVRIGSGIINDRLFNWELTYGNNLRHLDYEWITNGALRFNLQRMGKRTFYTMFGHQWFGGISSIGEYEIEVGTESESLYNFSIFVRHQKRYNVERFGTVGEEQNLIGIGFKNPSPFHRIINNF